MTHPAVTALIARSNRLGADPKNTNYAGGNTSAKGSDTDPATGEPIDLMWVKGSGGDLGTLTEQGLAVLRLDRMRALVDVYPGPDREDEMVGLFDYTLHGRGGAAPSIDTAMHGLVDADHVDHLHPDSGIAIATAADGEALTKQIFGDRVVWIPWRRPGFQLGLDIADVQKRNPQAIGTILGGHGITAWGNTSEEAEANSLEIIAAAERYIDQNGRPQPFGPPIARLPDRSNPASDAPRPPHSHRSCAAWPPPTTRRSGTSPTPIPSSSSSPRQSIPGSPRSAPAARTTSCAPRSSRWCSTCPPTQASRTAKSSADRTACAVPRGLPRLLRPARHRRLPGDARRRSGHRADPRRRNVQLRQGQADRPGRRRVLPQRDQRDARRRGDLAVPTHRRVREVPHRVLGSGRGQARAACPNRNRWPPALLWSRARHRASARRLRPDWPPRVPAW